MGLFEILAGVGAIICGIGAVKEGIAKRFEEALIVNQETLADYDDETEDGYGDY